MRRYLRPAFQGQRDYTPNELEFCSCGATFQPVGETRERWCPGCGRMEGRRISFHIRTRLPYSRSKVSPS